MAWHVDHRHPHGVLLDHHVVAPVALLAPRALPLDPLEARHLAVAVLEPFASLHGVDLLLPCHHRRQGDDRLRHGPAWNAHALGQSRAWEHLSQWAAPRGLLRAGVGAVSPGVSCGGVLSGRVAGVWAWSVAGRVTGWGVW